MKCFNEEACLEGDKDHTHQKCDAAYDKRSVMCSFCADSYWKNWGNFECHPCGGEGMDKTFVYVFKVSMFYFVCYVIARLFMGNMKKQN